MDTEIIKRRMKNVRSWHFWFSNLIRSVVGGASTALVAKIAAPNTVIDYSDMLKVGLAAAFVKAIMFLEKSPLPDMVGDEEPASDPKAPTI